MKRTRVASLGVVSLAVLSLVGLGLAYFLAPGQRANADSIPSPVLSLRGADPRDDFGAYSYRRAQPTHWHEIMLAR